MSEVSCDALSSVLEVIKGGKSPFVFLLHGDEFLVKSTCKTILDALLPSLKEKKSNCESVDGMSASVHEIIERMQTFALFPGAKVVLVLGARLFYSKQSSEELLRKSKEALEKLDMKRAARHFLQVLALMGLSLEEVLDLGAKKFLDKTSVRGAMGLEKKDGLWISEIVNYCMGEHMDVPSQEDDGEVLCDAVRAGFPKGNYLILAAESVDKRKRLFKTIKKTGVVIDCSIARGARAADRRQQKEILKTYLAKAVERVGKTTTPGTFDALFENTGADLRTFNSEVDKLITFVGDSEIISTSDVDNASEKTREDPVYELANAIGERVVGKALSHVDGLLKANLFPLQILSAVINQIRKLILSKDVAGSLTRGKWRKGMDYRAFQRAVLPELQKHEGMLPTTNVHPFVLYKTLMQAENFSFDELTQGLACCLDTDRQLKSSRQDPRLVLEDLVIRLCGTLNVPKMQ
jgi:DNA polymerase-3 subunit delta